MGKIDKFLAALTGLLLISCSFSSKFYDPSKNYRPIENINSQDIWFEYKNLKIHTLLLFPEEDIALNRLLILLQGKGGNASDWSEFAMPFVKKGYHVWIPEYPGHGLSEGKPSHRTVYKSMNSIVGKMIELDVINGSDKAILGFSLGANLSTKLAVNYKAYITNQIYQFTKSFFIQSRSCIVLWQHTLQIRVFLLYGIHCIIEVFTYAG